MDGESECQRFIWINTLRSKTHTFSLIFHCIRVRLNDISGVNSLNLYFIQRPGTVLVFNCLFGRSYFSIVVNSDAAIHGTQHDEISKKRSTFFGSVEFRHYQMVPYHWVLWSFVLIDHCFVRPGNCFIIVTEADQSYTSYPDCMYLNVTYVFSRCLGE